ncbi:MAG: sulfurtransferase [Phycisphaerae bacterium]|nr:sulfurtransferase [Phycisphaerae bacterium]
MIDDGSLPAGYPFRPDLELTPAQASTLLGARPPRLLLLDCRTAAEWAVARIDGSLHVPLEDLAIRADEIGSSAVPIAVICHHGVRSLRAVAVLRGHGFGDARSVAGGIDAWSRFVDAGVPRYVRGPRGCRPLLGA